MQGLRPNILSKTIERTNRSDDRDGAKASIRISRHKKTCRKQTSDDREHAAVGGEELGRHNHGDEIGQGEKYGGEP